MIAGEGTAASRYTKLSPERDPYLEMAYRASELTIPSLFPRSGLKGKVNKTWQGIGSRGVNNLAAKLTLALLPPNAPFFRYVVNELAVEKENQEDLLTEINLTLSKIERAMMREIEASGDRIAIGQALKHCLVSGNVLLHVAEEGTRMFTLDTYVVRRDPNGNVREIITVEAVEPSDLPEEFVAGLDPQTREVNDQAKTVKLYTRIWRDRKKFRWYQEAFGKTIEGTEGNSPLEKCPWIPLRMNPVAGESYGIPYVEEFAGDLASLEAITQALVEGAAAAAKVLIIVDPNGSTSAKMIAEAENGAVIEGNAADAQVLQMQKYADFRTAGELAQRLERRLELAFLLNTSVQRDAERVTAEEIRLVAKELNEGLGGVYSVLSQEFQLPYVRRREALMSRAGNIPSLPKKYVQPAIVTGIEALGRGNDKAKLVMFIRTLADTIGPDMLAQYVKVEELIARIALADGIDTNNLIRTEEEIAAQGQEAQMAQLIEQLGPNAVNQLGSMMQQQGAPAE